MPVKKTLRVTLSDGTIINNDLANKKGVPPLAQANDQFYYNTCVIIATQGLVHHTSTAKHFKLIPPSQIEFVEVIFEEQPTTLSIN